MKKIDTKKPTRIYDDRGKESDKYLVNKIIFEDEQTILAEISFSAKEDIRRIIINKSDNSVFGDEFNFWYAENYENPETQMAERAIKYVQGSYYQYKGNLPSLLLGDVAQLITDMTGVQVNQDDLLNK
jgi:hypothetical protein